MVTYLDLKSSRPELFERAGAACASLSQALEQHGESLGRQSAVIADAWEGADQVGGTAAVDFVKAQARALGWSADDLATISMTLSELATVVEKAKNEVDLAVKDAKRISGIVSEDGVVFVSAVESMWQLPGFRENAATAGAITQRIADAVAKATAADNAATATIRALSPKSRDTGPFKALIIPVASSPDQVKQWWDDLSGEQRQLLLAVKPDQIGRLDGVPAEYRDLANRLVFKGQIAATEDLIKELEHRLHTEGGKRELLNELSEVRDRLDGLKVIEQQLDRPTGAGGDDRMYLLGFDNQADGQAIVSVGNPDTADRVFTFVPGMTSDLTNFGSDLEKINGLVNDAKQQPGGQNTAGIVWLGYDAPDLGPEALTDQKAKDGADAFRNFQTGLRVTHLGPPSTNTVIGHSYGSLVVGTTATGNDGLDADQVIFIGSPGVGIDHVDSLKLDGDGDGRPDGKNVWSALTPFDPIVGYYGTQPNDEDFGARVFTTGPLNGHSGYLDEIQTTRFGARTNMARIITGNLDDVTMETDRFGRVPSP